MARAFGRTGARLYPVTRAGILFFDQDEQAESGGHGQAAELVRAPPPRLLGACVGELSRARGQTADLGARVRRNYSR